MFWKKILEHKVLQLENATNTLHKIHSKRSSRAIICIMISYDNLLRDRTKWMQKYFCSPILGLKYGMSQQEVIDWHILFYPVWQSVYMRIWMNLSKPPGKYWSRKWLNTKRICCDVRYLSHVFNFENEKIYGSSFTWYVCIELKSFSLRALTFVLCSLRLEIKQRC